MHVGVTRLVNRRLQRDPTTQLREQLPCRMTMRWWRQNAPLLALPSSVKNATHLSNLNGRGAIAFARVPVSRRLLLHVCLLVCLCHVHFGSSVLLVMGKRVWRALCAQTREIPTECTRGADARAMNRNRHMRIRCPGCKHPISKSAQPNAQVPDAEGTEEDAGATP